ncbi:MAG: hypothetical protein KDJ86_03290 [Bauldia sp.]|uniref:uracil-DNA glycosylase family protein n=1 Tax=Bauldia sp. TaxID=2575872 RepID=UPI001D32D9E8|nr:uracil-DNA glycosylase family protein [Bauldia sp.]MCB1494786.1 hypothetical protein [Bauldia sp.]
MIDGFICKVDHDLYDESGRVFYSGRRAFSDTAKLYVLGLNPGGDPSTEKDDTIRRSVDHFRTGREHWSAYCDEPWRGRDPGTHYLQRRVCHLLTEIGVDPRDVPASNVIFVRTVDQRRLAARRDDLLKRCWPVHSAVIEELKIKVILCMGAVAGEWTRDQVGATICEAEIYEPNRTGRRRRRAYWHRTSDRRRHVVTLPHPSRSNWCGRNADEFPSLVENALAY